MAVQLNNASSSQDYMQIPPSQTSARGGAPEATTGVAGAGVRDDSGRGGRANDFQNLLSSLKKTAVELSEKASAKRAAGETSDETQDAESESAEDLSVLVNPLIRGMEQLKQLIESMQAELKEGDVKGAIAIAQDAAAKVSRFDPDLILGKDFVDGSLGKKLQEFLADGTKAPSEPSVVPEETAAADATDAGMGDGEGDALLDSLFSLGEELNPTRKGEAVTDEAAKATSEKLAGIANELLKTIEQRNPALVEQLTNLRDAAENGLSPKEMDEAIAALDEILAALDGKMKKALDEAMRSKNPVEEYDRIKEDEVDLSKAIPSPDKTTKASVDARSQKGYQAASASDFEHDRGPAKSDFSHDLAASVRASLSGAAEEAFEVRPAATSTLGQPGVSYSLDPNDAFGDGVTTMLQFLRDEGISEARIVVEPPALGRIDVSLQATASGVEAVFKVDNEHLKQVLQQQLDSLKNSLEAQGIHVSGLAVDIKNRDDHRRQDAQGTNRKVRRVGGVEGAGDEDGEEPRLVRLDLEKGLLHWIA